MPRPARTIDILGHRLPVAGVVIMAATLLVSIVANNSRAVLSFVVLVPAAVWQGQVWRLVTWPFFESDPLALVFWLFLMVVVMRDLTYAWGARKLVWVFLGLTVATGLVTTAIGWFWRTLGQSGFSSAWAIGDGLFVAWAILNAHVSVRMMFVLPISGRQLVPALYALTLLFALMSGAWWRFIPHFVAMTLMLAYMRNRGLETAWLKLRYRWLQFRMGRRRSHLRVVDREPREPPRWVH
jgi:hypothetical protein